MFIIVVTTTLAKHILNRMWGCIKDADATPSFDFLLYASTKVKWSGFTVLETSDACDVFTMVLHKNYTLLLAEVER